MSGRIPLEGMRIGEWQVLKYLGNLRYECKCSCGRIYEVLGKNLKNGVSTRCRECYKESTREDIVGKTFGKWTVIKYIGDKKHLCRCVCGREHEVYTQALINGSSKQCQHCRGILGGSREKLEGRTINNWTILEYIGNNKYRCKCKCGNIEDVFTYNLTIGHSTKCKLCSDTAFKDISGMQFGEWKALEYIGDGYWNCMCSCGKTFKVHGNALRVGKSKQCTECLAKSKESAAETYLFNRYSFCERNNRTILNGKEIDLYSEDKKIGIEFNGTYWHSTVYKNKTYHQEKTVECSRQGIQLIHIFEYEWNDTLKREKILNYLDNKFEVKSKERIYARKTTVRQVEKINKSVFLNKYHMQNDARSSVNIGLYNEEQLIAVMTFDKPRFNNHYEWELIRYAVKDNLIVIGGAEKMFSYFIKQYNPNSIISYCDISKFNGKVYVKLAFKYKGLTSPNYMWVRGCDILSRYQTQKSKLIENNLGDISETEDEIMIRLGYMKIYDSGNAVFEWYTQIKERLDND